MEPGIRPDLNTIADRLAIREVLAMHSRGLDRGEQAALEACYWPEAEVAYGAYDGAAIPFCAGLVAALARYRDTQHQLGNTLIDLNGDEARVETYVTAWHLGVPDAEETEMTYIGRYVDRFQRRGDRWKILHRRAVMSWNQYATITHSEASATFSAITKSARYPDDPVYDEAP